MGMLPRAVVMSAMALGAAASGCGSATWAVAYSPENCHMEGDTAMVSCANKRGGSCGTRMSSSFHVGAGSHSMRIKAAAGSGIATTFYLSNNGGLYDKTRTHPWVELDFEIMGHMAGTTSKIWTNMFTGVAVEHNQWITVPFDVTADYHTYAIAITDHSVAWLVDGISYREVDLKDLSDVQQAVASAAFQEFISVWGKSSSEPGEGIPAFREGLGLLDQNTNNFPIYAGYQWPNDAGQLPVLLAAESADTSRTSNDDVAPRANATLSLRGAVALTTSALQGSQGWSPQGCSGLLCMGNCPITENPTTDGGCCRAGNVGTGHKSCVQISSYNILKYACGLSADDATGTPSCQKKALPWWKFFSNKDVDEVCRLGGQSCRYIRYGWWTRHLNIGGGNRQDKLECSCGDSPVYRRSEDSVWYPAR